MNRIIPLILAAILLASGCAQSRNATRTQLVFPPGKIQPPPESDAKSLLTLAQILPPTTLPAARPATRPDVPPPVESLALFARSRDEMLDNHPQAAIDILAKAISLDPDSFELYRAMGEARLAAAKQPNQEEIDAFENAARLRPDDLRLQALLGAQCAALGQTDKSMLHLRLAVQTHEYQIDDVAAAAVDLLLARILQVQGYDRAALDQYQVLLQRLSTPSNGLRADPELGGLAAQPQPLMVEIASLYERLGRWSEALTIYEPLASADPSNFEIQARVVRMLTNLGRTSDAIRAASNVVLRFEAGSDAIDLLKQVCIQQNVDMAQALDLLCSSHPGETSLRLAYAQVLAERGRLPDAQQVLESAAASAGGTAHADWRILDKLFDVYLLRNDVPSAARLMVDCLAAHPDNISQLDSWWAALTGPSRRDPLRIAGLQKLKVDPSSEAARNFLIWRMAIIWRRDVLAHSSLDLAVRSGRPFAPAFRQIIADIFTRPDWTDARKTGESEKIAKLAEQAGDAPLALEVRGLISFNIKRPDEAIKYLGQALAAGGSSSQLSLTYAAALHGAHQDDKARQILIQLVAQKPQFDEAWEVLFRLYLEQQDLDSARKVLTQWLAANPASVPARVLQAELAVRDGDAAGGEQALFKLFNDHPDNSDLIQALLGLVQRSGHLQQFIDKVESIRASQPNDLAVVQLLVDIYVSQNHAPEAVRVLDAARKAVATDADLLYSVSHLYERVDQEQTTEEILDQVVKLDPANASACNDLGYSWADQGRNLPRAESLIRVAVEQEPDNQSFLDSMGWVLYKQGKFGEAEPYFEKAVGPSAEPDPVVLNHYGDVLYRLGRAGDAAAQWRASMTGLDAESTDRTDLSDLRQTLTRKLAEQNAGQPVSVAPMGATK